MPVKGVAKVRRNVGRWVAQVQGHDTQKVLTMIAQTGAAYAKMDTPVDTASLINSQYYVIRGNQAIIGYHDGFSDTGFNYAFHLHESTDWQPRKKKAATHHFLSNAFEAPEHRAEYNKMIVNGYKV